jgi:hypothetical protein
MTKQTAIDDILRDFCTHKIGYFEAVKLFRIVGYNHRSADDIINNWGKYL